MRPDVRPPAALEQPLYGIGPGFVQHREGRRLTQGECEGCLAYHDAAVASIGASHERRENNRAWAAQLREAMAASFPEASNIRAAE